MIWQREQILADGLGPAAPTLIFLYYRIFQDSEGSQWHDLPGLIHLQAGTKAESGPDDGHGP